MKRFWKLFSFTMAALLTSGLVACSKDDEKEKEDPIDTSLIILSSDGESKESWNDLLCNIISGNTKTIQETVFYLKQKLITSLYLL